MFNKFRNFFNRECHRHKHRVCRHSHVNVNDLKLMPEGAISLDEAPEGKRITVVANSDIKTMEMGLYPGSIVTLVHNESNGRNIIVKVHDQRYVVPREISKLIYVKNK